MQKTHYSDLCAAVHRNNDQTDTKQCGNYTTLLNNKWFHNAISKLT